MEGNQNPAQPGQNQSQFGQNPANPAGTAPQMPSSQPQSSQTGPQQPEFQSNMEPPKSGSRHTLMLIILLVVAVVSAVIIYFILMNRDSNQPAPVVPQTIIPSPTPVMTEEEQLESIDVGDVDADLLEIESDLQSL